ncbi:unnamed protein product [Prorocentrum cordatum]|uniref:Uncharacterized protein n=1 Tax=Prorocentrum cordatum TaxID=2364126 RepID=A0ABN9QR38_9DINO|nr:unnamed protein product [Polarella glacialis]
MAALQQAGVSALLALPVANGLGVACGRFLKGRFERQLPSAAERPTHGGRLLQHLCSVALVALVYWLWAFRNGGRSSSQDVQMEAW